MIDYGSLRAYMIWKMGYIDEDAVQEGVIAAWQAEQTHPGREGRYYRVAAINGAKSYLMGKKMTGRDAKGKRRNGKVAEIATGNGTIRQIVEDRQHDPDVTLEIAVREALDKLPAAEYAYCVYRFWHGHPHVTASRMAGLHYTAWYDRIRPQLREALQ